MNNCCPAAGTQHQSMSSEAYTPCFHKEQKISSQEKDKSQIFDESCRRVKARVPGVGWPGKPRLSLSGKGLMLSSEMLQMFLWKSR